MKNRKFRITAYLIADRGLKPGMVLAIEPMVNIGERYVRTLEDNWTVVTEDGSWCAHFEHTVAVTADGYEILTQLREQARLSALEYSQQIGQYR